MSKKLTQKEFELKANEIHNNKYKYGNYISNKIPIDIYCPIHGKFEQRPDAHLYQKQECPKCKPNHKRYTKDEIIKKCNTIHNNKYNYPDEYLGMNKNWNIICKIHGSFPQKISNHIHLKHGCPKCKNKSIGESEVRKFLQKNNIKFEEQKKFKDCVDKKMLPFDFYLKSLNICIEYDGIQHFDEKSKFYSTKLIYHDKIKTNYCKENNIKLIRIKYSDSIEEKLKEIVC
jgi:very-short-patch-repair endonuclease